MYDPALEKAFPGVKVNWYQAGSETVASKLMTEKSAGGIRADVVMTSDLFFFNELALENLFQPLDFLKTSTIPKDHIHPNNHYAISRFPVMVIGYNNNLVKGDQIPKKWKDLLKPEFKSKISMPSPLESGSFLTGLFFLKDILGSDFFIRLKDQNILSAGGNGATLSRLLSGEKSVGILLLENILQAQEKGQNQVSFSIPLEGALPIPSPVSVFSGSKVKTEAMKIAEWFFSQDAQDILIKGWVYSTFPENKAPTGAPSWKDLNLAPWSIQKFLEWTPKRQALKNDFQEMLLR